MPKWNPKKLTGRHKQIMRMYAAGRQSKEIALALGISPQTVSITVTSEAFQQEFKAFQEYLDSQFADEEIDEELDDPVRELLKENAMNAAKKLIALMDAQNENIQYKSAMSILDRDGYQAVEKHEVENHLVMDKKASDNLGKALEDIQSPEMYDESNISYQPKKVDEYGDLREGEESKEP